MSAMRTQVYFTSAQRRALDDLAKRDGKTLAELVREAVDAYLAHAPGDPEAVLDAAFGAIPDLEIPLRDDWYRGYG